MNSNKNLTVVKYINHPYLWRNMEEKTSINLQTEYPTHDSHVPEEKQIRTQKRKRNAMDIPTR